MNSPERPGGRLRRTALLTGLLAGGAMAVLPAGVQAQPAVSRAVEVPPPKGWTPDMPLFAEEEPVTGGKRAAEPRGGAPVRSVTPGSEKAGKPGARAITSAAAEPREAGPQKGSAPVRTVMNKPRSEPGHRQAGRAVARADLRGGPASDRNTAAASHAQHVAKRADGMQPAPRRAVQRSGAVKAEPTERAGAHRRRAQAGRGPAPQLTTSKAATRQRARAGQSVPSHTPPARATHASMKSTGPKSGMAAKPAAVKKGTPRKGSVPAVQQKPRR